MKFSNFALAVSAAILPFSASAFAAEKAAEDVDSISYEDALQCTALMAVFLVIFEEDKDEEMIQVFDDQLTRWSMVATVRGVALDKEADQDVGAATEKLGEEMDAAGDDEAATEKLFEERGAKCMKLQEANQLEFDAVDVDAFNDTDVDEAESA